MEIHKRVLIADMLSGMKTILHELDIDYIIVGPIKKDSTLKKHKFEPGVRNKKIQMTISCRSELKAKAFKNALVGTGKYSPSAQNANALFYKQGVELNVLHQNDFCSDKINTRINRNICVIRAACFENIKSVVDKFFYIAE